MKMERQKKEEIVEKEKENKDKDEEEKVGRIRGGSRGKEERKEVRKRGRRMCGLQGRVEMQGAFRKGWKDGKQKDSKGK